MSVSPRPFKAPWARSSLSGSWQDRGALEEAFRILRSNLEVALSDIDKPRVIVTSANANEGKTVTCANLAVAFAAAGRRTVLVDLDLRHPNAHRLIGAHNDFGATDVLSGRRSLKEAMQFIEVALSPTQTPTGLYFLGTGAQVDHPAELLGSGRTARLLEGLAAQADLVLVDTPPVLPVADTLVIGRIASGAILVTQARATATGAVQQAKDLLIRNQTRIFGVVVNRVRQDDADAEYGYGYGYGYGAKPEAGPGSLDEGGNSHTLSGSNGSDPVTKWLSRTSAASRTARRL